MSSLLNNASLLLNPAGSIISYQEDKIFSVLPRNGGGDFTFSGGDGGTRVNQQGYIEQTPANIFTYSEVFTNGIWQYGAVTATDNQVIAPNGTQTGALMTISAGGHYFRQNVTVVPGSVYTLSFYAKRGTASDLAYSIYDLTNAANIIAATSYYSQTNSSEWSRISVTFTAPAGCISAGCYPTRDGGATGTFYLWGAMVNIGSTALPYQPTTDRLNYPRITYQNGRGALLSEPQRTNVNTYSQDFTNAVWLKFSVQVTGSAAISPDGTMNAAKLVLTATSGELATSAPVSDGYTTIFAKAGNVGRLSLYRGNTSFGTEFNLYNGTVISGTGTIEPYKDGWYRIGVKMDANRSINPYFTSGYTVGDYVYIWGAQSEEGNYPTSYIPTTSATVTRPADASSDTSATSVIGQTEGVIYSDLFFEANGAERNYIYLNDSTGYTAGFCYLVGTTINKLVLDLYNNPYTQQFSAQSPTLTTGRYKAAIAYKQNDFAFYLNGVQIATDNNGTVPTLDRVYIGQGSDLGFTNGAPVFTTALFNTRLTNTQLAELTTVRSGSGGNISYYGPYTIHTFTGSATFTPSFSGQVEVLVAAGGGAGGGGDVGGGGGAGGLLYVSSYGVSQGTGITVTIGAGGAGVANASLAGGNGSNSVFGGLTAIGGGGGAGWTKGTGNDGGSGGGATYYGVGGTGIPGQGNNGGTGGVLGTPYPQCGGGGAGQIGLPATGSTIAGNGGAGLPYSISGFSTYYAGGGGGATEGTVVTPGTPGTGGIGGGGNGGSQGASILGTPGVNGLGGGGGGCDPQAGASGGSGIVIVRYLT